MKPEPLENKRKDVIVYLDDIDNSCNYDFKNSEDGEIFMFDDIKSAVLGLKKEIESKKIPIEKLSNKEEVVSDTKEKFVSDFNQEIDDIVEMVNKWFKDVTEI